jgi:hemerythrin superfamily protein
MATTFAEKKFTGISEKVTQKLSSPITKMIRMDHSHVLVLSHKYSADASPQQKAAIVKSVCLALEIHAQLEEEIFYPAMREVESSDPVLDKSKPEHDEMRRLIADLRAMDAGDTRCDATFAELMRVVIHHVADEETVLLPAAERLLGERLNELGARMTKRRLQLARPHVGEMAVNTARAMPVSNLLWAAGLLLGVFMLGRGSVTRRRTLW